MARTLMRSLQVQEAPAPHRAANVDSDGRALDRPAGPWLMAQGWRNLLFAHWPLPPEALADHVPPGLTLDTFGGRAWLGITPFLLAPFRLRGLPALPGMAALHEINVRTYVV